MKKTFILWGIKPGYGSAPIKIAGGSLRECRGELRRREREGGWKLWILIQGLAP